MYICIYILYIYIYIYIYICIYTDIYRYIVKRWQTVRHHHKERINWGWQQRHRKIVKFKAFSVFFYETGTPEHTLLVSGRCSVSCFLAQSELSQMLQPSLFSSIRSYLEELPQKQKQHKTKKIYLNINVISKNMK